MTQRARRAIIDFWLAKQWSNVDVATLRRLIGRHFFSLIIVSIFLMSGLTSLGFAAEAKKEQPSGILKMLDSKIVALNKLKEKQKSEKIKKKLVYPDPNPEDMKAESEMKQTEGEITARNNYGIAVEYEVDPVAQSSKEIWLNFHTKAKVSGVKNLSDLREGDLVRVSYKLTKKTKHLLLDSVTFLGKKPKEEPQPQAPEESEAGTMNPATLAAAVKP